MDGWVFGGKEGDAVCRAQHGQGCGEGLKATREAGGRWDAAPGWRDRATACELSLCLTADSTRRSEGEVKVKRVTTSSRDSNPVHDRHLVELCFRPSATWGHRCPPGGHAHRHSLGPSLCWDSHVTLP